MATENDMTLNFLTASPFFSVPGTATISLPVMEPITYHPAYLPPMMNSMGYAHSPHGSTVSTDGGHSAINGINAAFHGRTGTETTNALYYPTVRAGSNSHTGGGSGGSPAIFAPYVNPVTYSGAVAFPTLPPYTPEMWPGYPAGWTLSSCSSCLGHTAIPIAPSGYAAAAAGLDLYANYYYYSLALQQQYIEQYQQQQLQIPCATGRAESADTVASVSGTWDPTHWTVGDENHCLSHDKRQHIGLSFGDMEGEGGGRGRGSKGVTAAAAAAAPQEASPAYQAVMPGTACTPPTLPLQPPPPQLGSPAALPFTPATAATAHTQDSLCHEHGSIVSGTRLTPYTINSFAETHCLICGQDGHPYASCPRGSADMMCLFNERDRHVYIMRHPNWVSQALLADVINFVETVMHSRRTHIDLWVDGRSLASVGGSGRRHMGLEPRDLRTPCHQLRLLPGAVVFVCGAGVWHSRRMSQANGCEAAAAAAGPCRTRGNERVVVDEALDGNAVDGAGSDTRHEGGHRKRKEGGSYRTRHSVYNSLTISPLDGPFPDHSNTGSMPNAEPAAGTPMCHDILYGTNNNSDSTRQGTHVTGGDEESGCQDRHSGHCDGPQQQRRHVGRRRTDGAEDSRCGGGEMAGDEAPRVRLSPVENMNSAERNKGIANTAPVTGSAMDGTGRSSSELSGISANSSAQLRSLPVPSLAAARSQGHCDHDSHNKDENINAAIASAEGEASAAATPTSRSLAAAGSAPPPEATEAVAREATLTAVATRRTDECSWANSSPESTVAQLLRVPLHPQAAKMYVYTASTRTQERRDMQRYNSAEARRTRTLHVKFLPGTMSFREIRILFAQFGELLRVRVICPQQPAAVAATGRVTSVVRDAEGATVDPAHPNYDDVSRHQPHPQGGHQHTADQQPVDDEWAARPDCSRVFLVAFVEYSCTHEALIARAALQGQRMGNGFALSISLARQAITGGYRTDYDEATGKPCTFGLTSEEMKAVNRVHGFVHWPRNSGLLRRHAGEENEALGENPTHMTFAVASAVARTEATATVAGVSKRRDAPRGSLRYSPTTITDTNATIVSLATPWRSAAATPASCSCRSLGPPGSMAVSDLHRQSPSSPRKSSSLTTLPPLSLAHPVVVAAAAAQHQPVVSAEASGLRARAAAVCRFFSMPTVHGGGSASMTGGGQNGGVTDWSWSPQEARELMALRKRLAADAATYAAGALEPLFYAALDVANRILAYPGVSRGLDAESEKKSGKNSNGNEQEEAAATAAADEDQKLLAPHPILLRLETLVYQAALWVHHDRHGDGLHAAHAAQQALALVVRFAQRVMQLQLILGGVSSAEEGSVNSTIRNSNSGDGTGGSNGGGGRAKGPLPLWRAFFTSVPLSAQYRTAAMVAAVKDGVLLPIPSECNGGRAETGTTDDPRNAEQKSVMESAAQPSARTTWTMGLPYPRVDVVFTMMERLLQLALLLDTFLVCGTDVLQSSRESSTAPRNSNDRGSGSGSQRRQTENNDSDGNSSRLSSGDGTGIVVPRGALNPQAAVEAPHVSPLLLPSPLRQDQKQPSNAAARVDSNGNSNASNNSRGDSNDSDGAVPAPVVELEEMRSIQRVRVELVSVAVQLHQQLNDFGSATELVEAIQHSGAMTATSGHRGYGVHCCPPVPPQARRSPEPHAAQQFWAALQQLVEHRLPSCAAMSTGLVGPRRKASKTRVVEETDSSNGKKPTGAVLREGKDAAAGPGALLARLAPEAGQRYPAILLENLSGQSLLQSWIGL